MTQSNSPVASSSWQENARQIANRIRLRVLEHTLTNNGGYMSQACSSAELFAALYTRILKLDPSQAPMIPPPFPGVPGKDNLNYTTGGIYNGPQAPHLDRFIFSPAHYALVLYTALIEVGRMAPAGLKQFNQDGSSVEMIGAEHSPGCEVTNGSLGQSISQAVGIALGRRLKGENGRVVVMMSDGEFNEGQTWEAIASMSHYKLDSMLVYVDVNGQCVDGKLNETMNVEPLQSRLEAFGMRVFSVNAHDVDALAAPAELETDGRPTVVLSYSNPTQGLPLLQERAPKLHYLRFKDEAERESFREVYQTMLAAAPATL
ncbi:MAG: transketolase [Chloroflexi bacterium HGW-Chloroflexi-10]|nr:MAG: transketolase [Chloroflexi bacterium HGW-Chloroflexi-10]